MMNLNADQVQHTQVIGVDIATGAVGTINYPELRTHIEQAAAEALAERIARLGFVAIAEPHIRLIIEASVIHPGYLTDTQRLLASLERTRP